MPAFHCLCVVMSVVVAASLAARALGLSVPFVLALENCPRIAETPVRWGPPVALAGGLRSGDRTVDRCVEPLSGDEWPVPVGTACRRTISEPQSTQAKELTIEKRIEFKFMLNQFAINDSIAAISELIFGFDLNSNYNLSNELLISLETLFP